MGCTSSDLLFVGLLHMLMHGYGGYSEMILMDGSTD